MEDNTWFKVAVIGICVVAMIIALGMLLHASMMANVGILLLMAAAALYSTKRTAAVVVTWIGAATGLTLIILAAAVDPNPMSGQNTAVHVILPIAVVAIAMAVAIRRDKITGKNEFKPINEDEKAPMYDGPPAYTEDFFGETAKTHLFKHLTSFLIVSVLCCLS